MLTRAAGALTMMTDGWNWRTVNTLSEHHRQS
jgi:hypothetical protein